MLRQRIIRNSQPIFPLPSRQIIPTVVQPEKPRRILRKPSRAIRLQISGILTILGDILNFAEQFVVFAQIRSNDGTGYQLKFILLAAGLAFFNLTKCTLPNRRIRICVSIIIDSVEFGIYYALLEHTTSLFIITTIFYGVELTLHIINFVITGKTKEQKNCSEKFIDLFVQTVMFFFCTVLPFMTLFMQDRTEFRKDYFEYLLILYLFIGTAGIEILTEIVVKYFSYFRYRIKGSERPKFYQKSEEEVASVKIFSWIKFGISIAINFLTMPILIFVISVIQLSKYGDTLATYDRNCYIIFISFISFYFLLLPFFIPLLILFIYLFIKDYLQTQNSTPDLKD